MWNDLESRFGFANDMRLLLGNMVLAKAVVLAIRWAIVVDIDKATDESRVQCFGRRVVEGVLKERK